MTPLPPHDRSEAADHLRMVGAAIATVGELMSPPPDPIGEFMSVVAVARRMRALGATSLPVCDHNNRFLGMLAHRDIVEQCVADGQIPSAVAAGSLLATVQPTLGPQQSADRTVLSLVLSQQLGELPVVEDGELVGLITVADLAASMFDDPDLLDENDDAWLSDTANGS